MELQNVLNPDQIKDDDISGACNTHARDAMVMATFSQKN
jgi:hypothetical protein